MDNNIITKEKLIQELKHDHVLVSDALIKRYFGVTFKQYKKREGLE